MFSAKTVKPLMLRIVVVTVFCCGLAFQGAPAEAAVQGDFNGDGYEDLAVGVPGEDIGGIVDAGAVQVFYGRANGVPAAQQLWHLNSPNVPLAAAKGDRFGSALAAGDFNDDGYDDMAVGIPNKNGKRGQAIVLYGRAGGLSAQGSQAWDQNVLLDVPESDDRFGAALAAGDFNDDGYADMAIGVPGEDFPDIGPPEANPPSSKCKNGMCVNAGVVNLIYGSATGLKAAGNQLWHQDLGVSYDGWVEWQDCFGASLAVGDFDGNGADDLAVGVPCEHTGGIDIAGRNQGAVSVYYGKASVGLVGAGAQYLRQWHEGVTGTAQAEDALGYALAAGDFNGDGFDDLAAGVPGEGTDIVGGEDAGAVAIFYGNSVGGLSATGATRNELLSRNTMGLGSSSAGSRWGTALAAGDYDGDGFADLAVGAPLDNVGGAAQAGSVSILFGSKSRFAQSGNQFLSQNSPGINAAAQAYDWFGQTLTAVDFNGNGASDLAVGAPFEDAGGVVNSGTVNLLFGVRNSGISTANNQYLNQGSPGGLDAVEAQDQFGGRAVPILHGNPWPSEPTPGGGGNQPPVLNTIGAKTAEVGRPLTFAVTASDADGPGPLVLRTANLPAGATFEDLGNGRGAFNWVPTAGATANSPYSVTFSVTENGGSGLSDTEVVRITVVPVSGGQGPYGGTPQRIPGKAEAENYDTGGEAVAYHDTTAANTGGQYRTDGVDIWKSATEGFYVGAIANGEWLEYTVNVATSGQYRIDLRVATPNSGRKIRLEMDGVAVGSVITLPSTGSWNTWQTVGATANLTSGRHVLRVVFVSGGFNFNWINIHK